jgi:hypothetical protein
LGSISIVHWLIVAGYVFLVCFPLAKILRRLGLSGWWALLAVVPLANLIALWILAFSRWPREPASN